MALKKYEHLRGKIPAFQQEPAFQDKVNSAKSEYVGLSVPDLAQTLAMFKSAKKRHEEEAAAHNVDMEAISQLLVDLMPEQNIKSIELSNGQKCSLQDDPYCSMEERDKLFAWLRRKKMQSIFTVNWQTLNGMVRGMLLEGKPQPPGCKMTLKTYAKITGGSQNGDE